MQPGEGVQSPEFDLVLACVRWPQEATDSARIRELARRVPSAGLTFSKSSSIIRSLPWFHGTLKPPQPDAVPQDLLTSLRRLRD